MENQTGIKIYTPSPSPKRNDNGSTTNTFKIPSNSAAINYVKKRSILAKGVQKTLSKTSTLANFLPTGTLITFEMVIPSIYHDGICTPVNLSMIKALLSLCTLSCFFFHFTDSFKGPDGKVYYGFVTLKGLAVFKPGLDVEVPKDERYCLGLSDFVHAIMSVMVFMAIALADYRVTNCLFPGHQKEMEEIMKSFPIMVGIICSGLFLVFPTTRYGVGCTAT